MRKRLALLLAFATVFTLISVVGVSAADDVNIAFGKPYTASTPYTDRTYPNGYQLIDGMELTDGVKGTTDYGTEWHGYYNQEAYFARIDLGKKYPGIKKITMQVAENNPASIYKPKTIEYFTSTDNKNYTLVGTATATQTGSFSGTKTYDYTLQLSTTVTARFVKAVITKDTGMFVFASEFEVFNSGEAGTDSQPGEVFPDPGEITEPVVDYSKIIVKEETGMKIVGDCIYGLQPGTYYEYAISQFANPNGLAFKNKDGNAKTSGVIGTGDKVELTVNGEISDTKTFIIDGDLNGDGTITSVDLLRFKKALLGNYTLEGIYLDAALIFSKNKLSQTDYLRMKKQALRNYSIYMNKYSEVELTYPMTLTRSAERLYTMNTKYNGKPLSLTMHQNNETNWTTWNIGTLTYDGSALAGVGTDWEYVYRVSDSKLGSAGSYPFCGGNHKNEKLREMKLYDVATGEELTLQVGETVPVDGIKIVEKTQILFNGSDTPWCDVVRTYYIAGNRIELLVDYSIIHDCYFALSYSCMFPVYRDFATHAKFYNTTGSVSAIEAVSKEQFGTKYPSGSGPYLGQLPTTKVKIWGDKNPQLAFDVQIYDPTASCNNFNNSEKTFLWEMSTSAPKLYFSKYNTGDAVKTGTTWSTKSTWAFYITPGTYA